MMDGKLAQGREQCRDPLEVIDGDAIVDIRHSLLHIRGPVGRKPKADVPHF